MASPESSAKEEILKMHRLLHKRPREKTEQWSTILAQGKGHCVGNKGF